MKLLLIHCWNENEKSYRNRFSSLFAYPSLTLPTIYSLIPKNAFSKIDTIDENSQQVLYDKEKYDLVLLSFETSSCQTAYKHCREFKKEAPILPVAAIMQQLFQTKLQCTVILLYPDLLKSLYPSLSMIL